MEIENEQDIALAVEEIDKGPKIQLIIFKLGQEEFALPIDQIKEIVITPRISKMPQTPDYVVGIANIRGQVISIMDFEKKFGLKSSSVLGSEADNQRRGKNFTLVIESKDHHIGVLVNEVPNTLSVLASKIDSSENIIQHSSLDQSIIKGVVKIEDRMIILIDVLVMMDLGELKTKM